MSVSYKKIRSDVPYSEEVVRNCMQETLDFFYFILTNRGDTDFILKDFGTLAIRGTEATMAFCEDFLLRLNKSPYIVEKLLDVSLLLFQCYLEWLDIPPTDWATGPCWPAVTRWVTWARHGL